MLFCGPRSKHRSSKLNITCNDTMLAQIDTVKYLGVKLDEHLTFTSHVDKLCRKVKSRSGVLWRMKSYISEQLAHDLYSSLIHPHFGYADIIYDACSQQNVI